MEEQAECPGEFCGIRFAGIWLFILFYHDPEGQIVYSTNEDKIGLEMGEESFVAEALNGSVGWSEFFFSEEIGENAMVVTAPIGRDPLLGVVDIGYR